MAARNCRVRFADGSLRPKLTQEKAVCLASSNIGAKAFDADNICIAEGTEASVKIQQAKDRKFKTVT